MRLVLLDGLPNPSLLCRKLSPQGRQVLVDYSRDRWSPAAIGGAASIGKKAIALWAMTPAPVVSTTALSETSVVFAAVLATLMLRERFGLQRATGAVVNMGG